MELFFFTNNLGCALKAQKAGMDSVIIDWELKDKESRQAGYDLETNNDSAQDVSHLAKHLDIPVTVRINALGSHTNDELNCAIKNGAKIVMLPMAKSYKEVGEFLRLVNRRAKTIIQVETPQLVHEVDKISQLGWDYVYIGLNDLMIGRGGSCIWEAVADGTVEFVCRELRGRKYGFAGITVLGGGEPIRFGLILHELIRLGCSMSFLRRSFKKEILDRDWESEIKAIRSFTEASRSRGYLAKKYDHNRLLNQITRLKEAIAEKEPSFIKYND